MSEVRPRISSVVDADLHLDWCSHKAAVYAVRHWHYSRSMPAVKTVKVGVWEHGKYIGVVIYSLGGCRFIGRPYGLTQQQTCELTRVALNNHEAPVTKIISISLRMLKSLCPGLRLVVSYADPEQGHVGAIYQAGNWIYEGLTESNSWKKVLGRVLHPRTVGSRYGTHKLDWLREHVDPNAENVPRLPKHKYLMPLDKPTWRRLKSLHKPYPKKRAGSIDVDASAIQVDEGGSSPTPALQNRGRSKR